MLQPKKQGNYFMLPNEIFNMDLTAGEIALYAFLMRMEDRKSYTCYPSFKTIGNALQMSKNTVMKYVRLLEEKELIETKHTIVEHRDGSLRNGNLMFRSGFFPQAATLQLRQKKTALVARNPKKAKNAGDYLKQVKASRPLVDGPRRTSDGRADRCAVF